MTSTTNALPCGILRGKEDAVAQTIDVSLVAGCPNGDESLALGYLAAALERAGHRVHVAQYRGINDLDEVARQVHRRTPILIGVAIPSGQAALEAVAWIHRVRQLGYRGHITTGGAWATLDRHVVLARCSALDSVIRHDGELPIVALANALATGSHIEDVPGLTTRSGDGRPAPLHDPVGLGLVPVRRRFPLYSGVRTAKISGVRGCWGRCTFCGLRAVREQALEEARALGCSAERARQLGVGSIRRRPVSEVADEMAELYHQHDVRYFHFVDENHLPRDPAAAERAIVELDRALGARKVGRRAINLMLRADDAHPRVVAALARLGMVRGLLGVESTQSTGLTELGRGTARQHIAQGAMAQLVEHRISFHFNVLLIRPDSTLSEIEQEVAALANVQGGLVDPFQVEPYKGTELFEKLAEQGRLEGGPLLYHFWPQEPGARAFTELFTRYKRDALGHVALTAYAYEVLGALAIGDQLGMLGSAGNALRQRAATLTNEHNRLWVDALSSAARWARGIREASSPDRTNGSLATDRSTAPGVATRREADRLVEQFGAVAAQLTLKFSALARDIECASNRPLVTEIRYPRAASAVAIAATVLAAACGGNTDRDGATTSTGGDGSGGAAVSAAGSGTGGDGTTPELGGTGSSGSGGTAGEGGGSSCTGEVALEESADLDRQTWSECGCLEVRLRYTLDADGYAVDVEWSDGGALDSDLKACLLKTVQGQQFPCLAQYPEYWESHCVLLA